METKIVTRIGGTFIAPIMGISKYMTKLDVYNQMLGLAPTIEENKYMKAGRYFEDAVAQMFGEETGYKILKGRKLEKKKRPYEVAAIDRFGVDQYDRKFVIEVKTSSSWKVQSEIPQEYYAQIQHYLDFTGLDFAYLVRYFMPRLELVYDRIERDDEFISKKNKAVKDFIENHLIPQIPPVVEEEVKVIETAVEYNSELNNLVEEYVRLKTEENTLKSKLDDISDKLKNMMINNNLTEYKNITCTKTVTERFDTTKFKKDNPALYSAYVKPSEYYTLKLKSYKLI